MRSGSRAGGSRSGGLRGSGSRAGGGSLAVPGQNNGPDSASLFDVVHGTSHSRAIGAGKNARFTNLVPGGRVSAAVADNQLNESPSRLNPNQVLLRERSGGADHEKEYAYRDENYKEFKKNIADAFDRYN